MDAWDEFRKEVQEAAMKKEYREARARQAELDAQPVWWPFFKAVVLACVIPVGFVALILGLQVMFGGG